MSVWVQSLERFGGLALQASGFATSGFAIL